MALGNVRRNARILAIETAASAIQSYCSNGIEPSDMEMDEDEFIIFQEECEKLHEKLNAMADKLRLDE